MIIVEGPDGAGKTTLVNYLAKNYEIPINEKVVASDTTPLIPDLKDWVERNLAKGSQRRIFDRHRLISEPIYQSAMGRKAQPGFDSIFWLTGMMLKMERIRPFVIYCLPPIKNVVTNLTADPDNVEVIEYIEQLYPAYAARGALDIAQGKAVHYDYTQDVDNRRLDMLFQRWIKVKRFEHDKAGG